MANNSRKIFTNKAISAATFIGGPLAAGFLISKNYKAFGHENAARNSIFTGIISTIILFAGIFWIPENIIDKIPYSLIPLSYTAIVALLVEKLQGEKIKSFLINNGQKASHWQAVGYGLLGLIVIAIFPVMTVLAAPSTGYENSITVDNNVKLYYSKDVEDLTSQKIADFIKQSGFTEHSEGAEIFLSAENNFYRLKFVLTDTSILSDTLLLVGLNKFEKQLNYNLVLDRKVEIGFTDTHLLESFELEEVETNSQHLYEPMLYLQQFKINDFHSIYYNLSMPVDEVKKAAEAIKRLNSYFPENRAVTIIFLNSEPDYTIKFFINKEAWQIIDVTDRFKSTVDYIKDNGIDKNINIIMIDNRTFEEKEI